MFWNMMQMAGKMIPAVGTGTTDVTDEAGAEVLDAAASATADAAQEVNRFFQFIEDNIPAMISFGIRVVLALVVFFVGGKVIKWIRKMVSRSFERTNVDAGVAQFVDSMLKFGLYALLIFLIATNLGVESSSIAALIASAGVAIGLAVQGSLSNFAGGVLILLLKPFAVGDYIIVTQEGIQGTVKEIQIFYTKLATVDNQRVVVPNSILTNNSMTNVTASPERQHETTVGISYDTDLKKARERIEDMIKADPSIREEEKRKSTGDYVADGACKIGMRTW